MTLASAMDIKEFEEKFHQDFADPEEEAKAAAALAEHEAQINAQHQAYVQGNANFDEEINEFADMDDDEFAEEHLGEVQEPEDEPGMTRTIGDRTVYLGEIPYDGENTPEEIAELEEIYASIDRQNLPSTYDSRAKGLVTKVKNQGNCGSCVAFATTAVLESNLLKAGASKDNLDISDQHLVDCGYGKYASGCNGAAGHGYAAFYNEAGKEMVHESKYPYVMKENNYKCKQTSYWHPGYKIDKGIWDYNCSDEKMMKLIYQYGAISTGVGVDNGFGAYKKGVYDKCTKTSTNHAVVTVGWGTENGVDYWLIKNSWGTWWGDQGYIKVKKSTCAIRRCVFFQIKKVSGGGETTTVKPTTPKPDDDCKDLDKYAKYCPSWAKKYCTGKYEAFMTKYCKKSCGHCTKACNMVKVFGKLNGDHTLKLTSNGKHFTSKVNCVDGACKATNKNIVDSCHYICGSKTCDHAVKAPPCKDDDKYAKYCPGWATKYCTGKYEAFMKKYCKKSCDLCNMGM